MIQIDRDSARMTVDSSGARPEASVGATFISAHLTKGFISTEIPPDKNKPAFEITGEADVMVDTQAEVDDILKGKWTFGFVQVCKINAFESVWTGRTKNEGEVSLDQSAPPALPANRRISLDSVAPVSPFVNRDPVIVNVSRLPQGRSKLHIKCKMGDHPGARQLKTPIQNKATRSPNFLRRLVDDSDFFTGFVVRDDRGVFQTLAHVHWRVAHDVVIQWSRRKPTARQRAPILQFDPFVRGDPSDAAVRAILANPAPPHTRDLLNEAGRLSLLNRFNLQVSPRRSLLVPNDFFQ